MNAASRSPLSSMQHRAYQIDLGRQVETPEFVIQTIRQHAEWGYDTLILYLEDGYRFPSHPEFAKPWAWTQEQMEGVVDVATQNGIKVIPVVPALGHAAYFLSHSAYRHLGEKRAMYGPDELPILSGQICPSLKESLTFLEDLFRDVAPFCTAGILHVSLDESLDLGICSLCKKEVDRMGHGGLFLRHLQNLHAIMAQMNLRMGIWGDMCYYFPEIISHIPKDTVVFDWFYYPFDRLPRVELFNFREIDSAGALRKAGLEVWACPNNGPFFCEIAPPFFDRLDNIRSWWRYGEKTGCAALALTSWSPNYASVELNSIVNAAAADLWLAKRPLTNRQMLKNALRRCYGEKAISSLPALEILNRHQLAGHWRYQIVRNRLAKIATLEDSSESRAAVRDCARVLRRLETKSRDIPAALLHTVRIRDYYAHKQRLGEYGSMLMARSRREAQEHRVVACRKTIRQILDLTAQCQTRLRIGMRATRALWKTTRYAQNPNPLLTCMENDRAELKELERSLRRAQKKPETSMESNPLLPVRHFLVRVRSRKPCLQGLQVQISTRNADRPLDILHTLYLLEFTADAGQRERAFVHTHAVPIPEHIPDGPLCVRLCATGLGEVDIADPVLLEGTRHRTPTAITAVKGRAIHATRLLENGWATLGDIAPQGGFPTPDLFSKENWVELLIP